MSRSFTGGAHGTVVLYRAAGATSQPAEADANDNGLTEKTLSAGEVFEVPAGAELLRVYELDSSGLPGVELDAGGPN